MKVPINQEDKSDNERKEKELVGECGSWFDVTALNRWNKESKSLLTKSAKYLLYNHHADVMHDKSCLYAYLFIEASWEKFHKNKSNNLLEIFFS